MRSSTEIDFRRRVSPRDLLELMDGDCSYKDFRGCLRSLEQINHWLLGYRPTLAWLKRLPRGLVEICPPGSTSGQHTFRVLQTIFSSCQRLEDQFGSNGNGLVKAEVHWAFFREEAVDPGRRFAVLLFRSQPQLYVNAADHQDVALQFHFPHRFGHQTFIRRRDLTRFQRAPEGSGKSTGRGSNNVVERCGVRRERVR